MASIIKSLLSRLSRKKSSLKFIYSDSYWMFDIEGHIFPLDKYRLLYKQLIRMGVKKAEFLSPEPAQDEDIARVHTSKYLKKLTTGTLSTGEILTLELPFSEKVMEFARLSAGGSIKAALTSLDCGLSVHIGGGFHHAFADHGEGFCVINDIAIALEKLRSEDLINKAMIVDCDVHQGNGTAKIFEKKPYVFTFSIHQMDIYPSQKVRSSRDVGLWSGDGDEPYISALETHIPQIFEDFLPDIVCYVAGADPLGKDRLGGLDLTFSGLEERDRIIIEEARRRSIPVFIVLAGGYATDIADTVKVHMNTIRTALKISRRFY